ncbi:MAG: aa3-type cytochrome c oxidase subunit IV [Rhodobacteraceae bacterium]|nr:aa3-type cytochrome c oxidase subunit IV [Paracoccaceae bacterium]
MSEQSAPEMDYEMHEGTYEGFLNFSKIGTLAVLNIVLCLLLFAFGGTFSLILGWIMLLANFFASAVGIKIGANGWIAPGVVFVLTGLFALVTI